MCDIVEGFKNEGRLEEKAELVRKMLDAKLVTEKQIADLLKISVEDVQKLTQTVPVMN